MKCSFPLLRPPSKGSNPRGAFTLIELLVVVALIAILAGLTLATMGYVNKKGAESRARSEVAALSAAIESFKLDFGAYPSNAAALYTNLCAGAKVYFEPNPQMLVTNGGDVLFNDPWSAPYQYSNFTTYFELWSTAGGANSNAFIRN
jgi:general secretion pathway protein G